MFSLIREMDFVVFPLIAAKEVPLWFVFMVVEALSMVGKVDFFMGVEPTNDEPLVEELTMVIRECVVCVERESVCV